MRRTVLCTEKKRTPLSCSQTNLTCKSIMYSWVYTVLCIVVSTLCSVKFFVNVQICVYYFLNLRKRFCPLISMKHHPPSPSFPENLLDNISSIFLKVKIWEVSIYQNNVTFSYWSTPILKSPPRWGHPRPQNFSPLTATYKPSFHSRTSLLWLYNFGIFCLMWR